MAPVIPWIVAATMAASTATSVIGALRTPKPPQLPPDRGRAEAAYAEMELLRKRRGAASTIITGPQGVTQPAQTTKAQLGG